MSYSIKDAFKSLEQLEEETKLAKSTKLTEDFKVGDKIKIVNMQGEPQYKNKEGKITSIDDLGQLHGTWGGVAVIPEEDEIEILKEDTVKKEEFNLPSEVTFTASEVALDTDDEDPADRLSDLLSDTYGFTHYGFDYEVVKNKDGEPSEFICKNIKWDTSESLKEDTKKLANGKWANVGKDGKVDSGTFKTKKEADAQRKAMFANKKRVSEARGVGKGQSLDKYFKIVNNYNDPYNQVKEEDLDLLLKIKTEIIRYVPKSAYEARDKENLLDIIEHVISESKYGSSNESIDIKEAKESKLEKEGIQYFGTKNQFNYDKLQLRIDHDNKTYQLGAFTHIAKRQTVSGPELRRIIKRLEDAGYKKISDVEEDLSVSKHMDLIDFIKKTIKDSKDGLNEESEVVSYFDLDNTLSVIFVWEDGYEKNNPDYIYSQDGDYVLTVGVGVYKEDAGGSYYLIPYNPDSYEVYDSFDAVYTDDKPRALASRLLQQYNDIINTFDVKEDGKLYPKEFEDTEDGKTESLSIKENKKVGLKSVKKTSLKEDDDVYYIYEFYYPDITDEDKDKMKEYRLEVLGKTGKSRGEKNLAVKGKLNDLKKYCKDYLDYEMHPDYLIPEDDFVGDYYDEEPLAESLLKEDTESEIKAYLDWCKENNKDASNGKVFLDYCKKFNIGKSKDSGKEDGLKEDHKNSKYSLSEIKDAVEYAFGLTGKERDDYIKSASSKTLDALVDGFKSNAKKSFFADSLNKDNKVDDTTLSEEDSDEKCNDMKSCLDRAVKQLTSKKESLNQDNKKTLKENIGNYKIVLLPRANSRGEFCVRVYENLKRDINKSFYTKDYNEALEQFKQISAKLKQALKESFADNIEKHEKRHNLTDEEKVVFENAIDCLTYGYGFKSCNIGNLDEKRAREVFELAREFLGDYDKYYYECLKEDKQFSLRDANEVEDAKKYLNTKKEGELEQVVDVDADNPEQLKTSYIGDILLRCRDCRTVKFKNPEDVVKDENTSSTEETQQETLYNVGEECPHCGSTKGYTIAGQVVAADIDLTQQDEETSDSTPADSTPTEQQVENEPSTEVKDEIIDDKIVDSEE